MKALSILIQVLDGKLGKCFEVWSALDFQNSVPKIWSVSALPMVLWLGDSAGWSEANDHGGAPHALQNRVARLHRAGCWAAGRCVVDADPKVNWLWLESCRENHGKLLGHPDWTPRCAPLSLYKAALDILQGTCGLENSLMLWSPENQWEATGVDFHLLVQAAWRAWTWWSSAKRFGLCSLVQYGWGGATCHGWGKSPLISDGRFADFPSCPSAFFPYMFVFFMCSFSWYDEIYAHIYIYMPFYAPISWNHPAMLRNASVREVDDEEANEEFAMTPNGGTIASWLTVTVDPFHWGPGTSRQFVIKSYSPTNYSRDVYDQMTIVYQININVKHRRVMSIYQLFFKREFRRKRFCCSLKAYSSAENHSVLQIATRTMESLMINVEDHPEERWNLLSADPNSSNFHNIDIRPMP